MNTAPLDIVAEKSRYPGLFQAYVKLSDRERSFSESSGEPVPTDYCTKISGVDFKIPLKPLDDRLPFQTDSTINKFCNFLRDMLDACDSGSIGGNACRMNDVLESAIDDLLSFSDRQERIECLLGLTIAVCNHGMHDFFNRFDPDHGRLLFKIVTDEWKKFTDGDRNRYNLSNDVEKFALMWSKNMQKMLKSTYHSKF